MKVKIKFFLLALLIITLDSCSTTKLQIDPVRNDIQEEEIIIDDIVENKEIEEEESSDNENITDINEDDADPDSDSDDNIEEEKEENNGSPVISEENFIIDETNNTYVGNIQNNVEVTINSISMDLINADFQNNNTIMINGDFSMGINAVNSNVVNNDNITLNGSYSAGISSVIPDKASILINNGDIFIDGYYSRGFFSSNNSEILNDTGGVLYVRGEKAGGISINHESMKIPAINKGKILVSGKDAVGMSTMGGLIINEGIIEVTGENAVGMHVYSFNADTTAVNNGEILVGKNADSAITAIGSNAKIENNGIIRLDQNHPELEKHSAENIVLKTLEGAEIINTGIILTEGIMELLSDNDSVFKIGTAKNKEYGSFSASEIKINGNIIIDTTIATSGYEEKYILSDIFKADLVEVSDEISLETDSILYKANLEENETGGLNIVLSRTNHTFSTLTDEKYKTTANIFTNAMNIEEYSKLSKEAQDVVDTVYLKSKTAELINQAMKEITPTLYSYIENHIINTETAFQNSLNKIISNIKNERIGFSLITEFNLDNKDSKENNQLPEYNSRLAGIASLVKFNEYNYFNMGYGKSLYKDSNKNKVDSDSFFLGYNLADINETFARNIGFLANYNKNNGKRTIDILNMKENAKFNSYSFSIYGNISQKYGKVFILEPYAKFTALYGHYGNISESGKVGSVDIEEEYFGSMVPIGGIKMSINKSGFNAYILGEIGYELIDTNQDKKAVLNGFDRPMIISAYKNNRTRFNTGLGLDYQVNKLNISLDSLISLLDNNSITGRVNVGYSF